MSNLPSTHPSWERTAKHCSPAITLDMRPLLRSWRYESASYSGRGTHRAVILAKPVDLTKRITLKADERLRSGL